MSHLRCSLVLPSGEPKEAEMAMVVLFKVSGMPVSKYDSIIKELEEIGQGAPEGRKYHVCFGDKDQIQVIDVYDNPASFEAFGAHLMPILQKHGVSVVPQVLGETHNIIVGR
jgi:hypothetical protein